jgi:predicted RNase H-like nuclease (RuvC/YqgF family)
MVKKKSKADPPPGVNSNAEQLNTDLVSQLPGLEALYKARREAADEGLRRQGSLQDQCDGKTRHGVRDVDRTLAIAADLAREYKALQEELIASINSLESRLTEYREEAEMARHELALMARDKDDEIAIKDQVIFDLRMKINEMTSEFSLMLQNATSLMRQKLDEIKQLDVAASVVPVDDALNGKTRVAYLQRLQDFTMTAN